MVDNSLSHDTMQNQYNTKSSWMDDPFDLKGSVKRMTNMSNEFILNQYAQELAYSYGKFDGYQYSLLLSSLPEEEQNELVRLHIETIDREVNECVYGGDFSINNNYTCALLAMLKDDCNETKANFAQITRKNTIAYFADTLQRILDGACHDLHCSLNNEVGLYSYQDKDNGEIFWERN